MESPTVRLLRLLDLEDIDLNIFRGYSPKEMGSRIFGGQVLAQALVAAGRTVDVPAMVHSMHAYFLRPGDPQVPILFEVDRSRDGRSFISRRVVAIQHGKQIFHTSVSFQVEEGGLEHQSEMPVVPAPEDLPSWLEVFEPYKDKISWYEQQTALDFRYVEPVLLEAENPPQPPVWRVWFRLGGTVPDDHLLHCALAAYASDMILLDTTVRAHGIGWFGQSLVSATLDHAMWFHRRFRIDDWVLFDLASPSTSGARGLATGSMFTRDGVLAASMAQEGLIRRISRTES